MAFIERIPNVLNSDTNIHLNYNIGSCVQKSA